MGPGCGGAAALLGLCLALAAGERAEDAAAAAAALREDDECGAPGAGGPGACALSAVQLRAEVDEEERAAGDRASAAGAADRRAAANATWPFSSTPTYTASCFGNAGAELCATANAPQSQGRCACPDGCLGADGNCYQQENKVIAKDFTIKNMKWPDNKMYVQRLSVFNQMKTTGFSSTYNLGQDLFTLYELPGTLEGYKEYFLASSKWPDYVVAIDTTGGTAVSLWGAYAVSLTKNHQPWNLRNVMMRVCSVRNKGYPNAVMIGSSLKQAGSAVWAYIHSGSYFVYGYWYPERLIESKIIPSGQAASGAPAPGPAQVPGEPGYWIPDPPFKAGLIPDCED